MILIDTVLIGDAVVEQAFVCDLTRCKGGCCEEGDAGAPLDPSELDRVLDYYEKIKPYMSSEGIAEVERNGKYTYHREFGWVTPTLKKDHELCAYGKRDEHGVIQCAFERAWADGVIPWKKPVSCHLFPIILTRGRKGDLDRMNYEPRERLCRPACTQGKKLGVPLYVFLKEPIVRTFGEAFYNALEEAAQIHNRETD
ncbi:MAG: hypothetical protein RJA57_1264 [Bacteroidota bacterium]|jgi:hypothetical protein